MKVSSGMSARDAECHTAVTGKVGRAKGHIVRKTSWVKAFLDLAIEVVSETRSASNSRAREPGELAALRGRMKDRQ